MEKSLAEEYFNGVMVQGYRNIYIIIFYRYEGEFRENCMSGMGTHTKPDG
jgi:hypothetical protein